jgi:hypothetical protein
VRQGEIMRSKNPTIKELSEGDKKDQNNGIKICKNVPYG